MPSCGWFLELLELITCCEDQSRQRQPEGRKAGVSGINKDVSDWKGRREIFFRHPGFIHPSQNRASELYSGCPLGVSRLQQPLPWKAGCSELHYCPVAWVLSHLHPTLCHLRTVACQASLSIDFPGKNTGLGSHSLLQGIFPTQGSNPWLLHCRQILHCLHIQTVKNYQGSPMAALYPPQTPGPLSLPDQKITHVWLMLSLSDVFFLIISSLYY